MKTIMDFHHQEYVYHFLMGLNDSFSNIRGQILLIEPLTPINKVFSLVLQDEPQREFMQEIFLLLNSLIVRLCCQVLLLLLRISSNNLIARLNLLVVIVV
jgi:hypothetical protein